MGGSIASIGGVAVGTCRLYNFPFDFVVDVFVKDWSIFGRKLRIGGELLNDVTTRQ